MQFDSNRFFVATKSGGGAISDDPSTFFLKQHIGRYTFFAIVHRVCSTLDLRGDGAVDYVTTHGLRSTMISLLINAGFDDATITLRTGHRCISSLRSYHNLRSDLGLRQFRDFENDNVEKDFDSNSKDETDLLNEQETDCGANLIKNSNSKCEKTKKSEKFKLLSKSATPIVSANNSVVNITIQQIHNH